MEDGFALHTHGSTGHSVRGMETVIATVSGYHGLERFKLIKLINYTGASYVGAMTKSTTHLVCWRFEGKKYELAKSFGTIIVSHRWFEDCVKAGKRLPERHYMMKSGQQVGPLTWEPPVDKKENSLTRKKGKILYDLSNTGKATREIEMNAECIWSDSRLLSENSSPSLETNVNSHKSGNSTVRKCLNHESRLNSKHFPKDRSSSGSIDMLQGESNSYSSTFSARHKRNLCSTVENSITIGPTRKGRRLVKKNASGGTLESSRLNSEQEKSDNLRNQNAFILGNEQDCSPIGTYNITTENIDLDCFIKENIPVPQGRNSEDNFCSGQNRNEVVENVEDITEVNNVHAVNDLNLMNEGVLPVQDTLSQHGFLDSKENIEGTQEVDGKFERATRLPASAELSCVICWTDFSSTRGVLPCGHRFCYSCIQSWADHMASRRKVSTCPLCKASFVSITKVDGAAFSDQKIYSQTIPYDSSATDIFVLPDWDISSVRAQSSAASVCCECRFREPEDLLIHCHLCSSRLVHSYCLDPPLTPWTCNNCRDLRMLYQRYH